MYKAFAVFAEHAPWKSTLLLMLSRESRQFLKPRMCWKDLCLTANLDNQNQETLGQFIGNLENSPDWLEIALRQSEEEFEKCVRIEFKTTRLGDKIWHRIARIYAKWGRDADCHQLIPYPLLCCAAAECFNKKILESDYIDFKYDTWKFQEIPVATLDYLTSLDRQKPLRSLAKQALASDNLDMLKAISPRLDRHLPMPHWHSVGRQVSKWMFETGQWNASHAALIRAIANGRFGLAESLKERVGWEPQSMRDLFDVADHDYDIGGEIRWMRDHGCPWDLTRFYENPSKFYELSYTLAGLGMKFDQATMDDLCKRATRRNNLFKCARAIAECVNPYLSDSKKLDTKLLVLTAARLGRMELLSVKHYPWDGEVWYAAGLARCDSSLEYLASIRHTWKTSKPINWYKICQRNDWKYLHQAGSPCHQRHYNK